MKNFYQRLISQSYTAKKNSMLYSLGMMFFSGSSILLLVIVTRLLGKSQAGIFSIGWAICQQMLTVGLYGTRNIQVSDIERKYSFSDFFILKFLTNLLMIIGCLLYGQLLHLDNESLQVAVLLTILMSAESFADIFAGEFQRRNQLAISGGSYIFRILSYDVTFLVMLIITQSLRMAIISAIGVSFLLLFILDYQIIIRVKTMQTISFNRLKSLLVVCLPICFSAFLTNYIVNIPKNAIALTMTNANQAIYNILAMPSFVISLFASVFLVPMYTKIAQLHQDDLTIFKKLILKIVMGIIAITIIFIILGITIGLPIMRIVFGVQLAAYKQSFALLLLAGGFSSLATFFVYILTIFQKQQLLFLVYGIVAVVATYFGKQIVTSLGILGASSLYLIAIGSIAIILFLICFYLLKNDI